jgi:hypothetical protein
MCSTAVLVIERRIISAKATCTLQNRSSSARVCVSASAALCEITLHAEQRLMMLLCLQKSYIDAKRDVLITGVEPFLEQVTS